MFYGFLKGILAKFVEIEMKFWARHTLNAKWLPPSTNHYYPLPFISHFHFEIIHFISRPHSCPSMWLTKKTGIQASGYDHYTHHHNTNYSKHLKRFIIFYYGNYSVPMMCMKIWYTANYYEKWKRNTKSFGWTGCYGLQW